MDKILLSPKLGKFSNPSVLTLICFRNLLGQFWVLWSAGSFEYKPWCNNNYEKLLSPVGMVS